MTLLQLHTPLQAARWLQERLTGTLSADSRKTGKGDGFIAWPGLATDGRCHVNAALAAGAAACLVEHSGVEAFRFSNDSVATYTGLKAQTGPIASLYFGVPADRLQVAAVTGTNGKTSTAWWLAQALGRLGRTCGMVGTLGIGTPGAMVANGLTTPDPVLLQQQLGRFVDDGFSTCVLEASSIGLEERRLDGCRIQLAIFTNFTQDHLDYHASMQAYWQAKKMLFSWPGLQACAINLDDAKGRELEAELADAAMDIWTFSSTGPARLIATNVCQDAHGLRFDVVEGSERHALTTAMVGLYNVSNLLGVIASLRAWGVPLADAVIACTDLLPVPGRTETLITAGLPMVVIDYAHTPDALEKVLAALQPVARGRGGRLWCVFGCGGDRDANKRPQMATIAEKNADQLVLTSDNPRSEDPLIILAQMREGLAGPQAVRLEPDRRVAIAHALACSEPHDVVLLAGKGHENYQEIKGVKLPFSDREQAQDILNTLAAIRQPKAAAC